MLALGASAALADSTREFAGEITNLDRHSKSVVVKGEGRKMRFFLARGGQVTSAGQPVAFADLKRGDRVEVAYTKASTSPQAQVIAVVGDGTAPAAIGLRE